MKEYDNGDEDVQYRPNMYILNHDDKDNDKE